MKLRIKRLIRLFKELNFQELCIDEILEMYNERVKAQHSLSISVLQNILAKNKAFGRSDTVMYVNRSRGMYKNTYQRRKTSVWFVREDYRALV
jgi:uncharacterized protein (DUF2384 family)|tara:strand:- start:1621 stop:1899 length:279 start_codon:yes stop_codon:yes gene_type:complete